jgi:hypothetical protein
VAKTFFKAVFFKKTGVFPPSLAPPVGGGSSGVVSYAHDYFNCFTVVSIDRATFMADGGRSASDGTLGPKTTNRGRRNSLSSHRFAVRCSRLGGACRQRSAVGSALLRRFLIRGMVSARYICEMGNVAHCQLVRLRIKRSTVRLPTRSMIFAPPHAHVCF